MVKPEPAKPAQSAILPYGQSVLTDLLAVLTSRGYQFICPTPATHARVLARVPGKSATSLQDMLGWNLPFESGSIDDEIEALLTTASAIEMNGERFKSRLRASTLGDNCFLHSSYPTDVRDAVFFGPDSYRFARLIRTELQQSPCAPRGNIVDIGTGSGVGGIVAARLTPAARLILTDVNPAALHLARANAAGAGLAPTLLEGSILAGHRASINLALANPPYVIDEDGRIYRDGGDMHGASLSLRIAEEVLPRLSRGGRFILYTGSAIVRGQDQLRFSLSVLAEKAKCRLDYEEIDVDVFGEELERDAYRDVDRIAVISAIFRRKA